MMYDYVPARMYYEKTRNDAVYIRITVRASGPSRTEWIYRRLVS